MSDYTSPPPYQPHTSTPQMFSHGDAHSTPQAHTHGRKGPSNERNFRPYGASRGYVHQPSVHIVVPASPTSETVIHHVPYRSNEIDPLLSTRRRRNNGPRCCFFTTLGAVLIFAMFAFVFASFVLFNGITWTNLESHSCTTYATREYTAELSGSPFSRRRMEICIATPVLVHDWPQWPSRCEYRSGKVIGHFAISNNEPDCVTYWSGYRDMGCTAPGSKKRHIEQRLENLPFGSDYMEFCATTPTRFLDMKFSGADSCVISIWGVYGEWFLDDDSC